VDETMKRNYPIDAIIPVLDKNLIRQVVFHEAGHAAAIHLYNRQKRLPPVYFHISIKQTDYATTQYFTNNAVVRDHFAAIVEGGHLIHSLPVTLIESVINGQDTFRMAYEADMVNLLVGPLAEAKYVALRDNECFNKNLISVNALHHYGGTSDLEKVYDYLENFIADTHLQEEKLVELLSQAFEFIESPVYWGAIENLATYIQDNMSDTISCEDAIAVLDASMMNRYRKNGHDREQALFYH
jgi:hypothetical protein